MKARALKRGRPILDLKRSAFTAVYAEGVSGAIISPQIENTSNNPSENCLRAQASVEFMIVIAILLTAIIIISVMSIVKTREIEISNIQGEAEGLLTKTGGIINTAYLEGDGFITNVSFPDTIMGANYTINTSSNFLTITVQGNSYTTALLTNVTGSLHKGSNTLQNSNGEVSVA